MLFCTIDEIRSELKYHGVAYNKILELALRQLRAALNLAQSDKSSKFSILMHATFELCHRENINTRFYDVENIKSTKKASKLQFAIAELTYAVKEVEKKYDLYDRRPKSTQADLFLKASIMIAGKFQTLFSKFRWCHPKLRKSPKNSLKPILLKNALAKSPVIAVKISPQNIIDSPCSGYYSDLNQSVNQAVTPQSQPSTPFYQPVLLPVSAQPERSQQLFSNSSTLLDSQKPENLNFYQTYYDQTAFHNTSFCSSYDQNSAQFLPVYSEYDIPYCYNSY